VFFNKSQNLKISKSEIANMMGISNTWAVSSPWPFRLPLLSGVQYPAIRRKPNKINGKVVMEVIARKCYFKPSSHRFAAFNQEQSAIADLDPCPGLVACLHTLKADNPAPVGEWRRRSADESVQIFRHSRRLAQ
jgi:hypothetical protein